MDGPFGKADPFVTFWVNQKRVQTSTIKTNTLAPTWDETFDFKLDSEETCAPLTIGLNCYDYDKVGANDKIGNGELILDHALTEPTCFDVQLEKIYNKKKKKERGTVTIKVYPLHSEF
eukprot:Awhi_evm1s12855